MWQQKVDIQLQTEGQESRFLTQSSRKKTFYFDFLPVDSHFDPFPLSIFLFPVKEGNYFGVKVGQFKKKKI